ncbi:MAG: hypothetical protein WCA08_18230, partial [Desulfoferrobacter sp.]
RPAAPFTAGLCLPPVHLRTIQRESYRTSTALRSHWKTPESCGSDNLVNGRKDVVECDNDKGESSMRPANARILMIENETW